MAKVKINFASLTDAQNAAPAATESASTKSTGFNFSSLADSDVATPEAQPSKKKVDTGLSGTTSSTVGIYKPVKVALPKATEDDDSIWDNLAGFASTVKNSLSPALRTLPVNLVSGATAFVTNLVTGVIKNTISEEDFKKDPYLQTIVDTIEKPSKDLLEVAANVNKAVQPQIDLAKAQAGVKEEYMNMPISETMSKDVGQGFRKLGVAAVSQIPQFVGLALAGGGSKARTFIAGATLGTTQAIQQEYEQDKDISGIDVAQSAMKGVIEGLTEMIFDTDLKAAQNIGKAVVDVTIEGGKKAIKDMIESVGKEATRNVIVRNYKDVVKNGLKGMSEESLEEVIATGASFVVDAIDSGKLNVNDYKKLAFDMLDAGMIGAAIGGPVSVMSAVLSKKNLTEEQKVNVSKFQEVANDKSLSPEIRQIAKDRINKIVDYDSDLVEEQYNKLAALPLNNRLEAFGVLSKINSLEEDSRKIKDLTLQEDNKKIIDGYKADLDKIFEANKPAAEVVEEPKTVTPEEAADLEKARQEELAKANESFKATMGVPSEPMKVSPEFSIKIGNEELGVNNAYEPSPNMPLEVVKKEEVKPVQFTTKSNPDSLLEGEVYTVSQGNKKFGTILSTSRNGVQEYYIPEMDNAKPYSNLDDAKFALEERLRGRFIPEVERSGIDRLRADKGLPKVDLVYKNDNGEDVVLPSESKKSIQNAVKAFKTVSPAPVYLYKSTEDFKKGVAKELGEDSKALEEAGKVGGGFFTNARNEDSIHINLANLNKTSVAHELFHGTVVNIARQNPSAFAEMRDAIINKLGDNELINVIDENGKRINLSAKEYLDRYSKQYSPSQQAEEFLGELTGLLTTDIAKLKDPTIWETIKLAIRNLVKTAGIDIPIFEKTANINQTVSFFNDLAKSLKTGEEIKLGKLNLKNEKQTTKQGTAVQATDGKSKAREKTKSVRDAVSEIVDEKQPVKPPKKRSGNPNPPVVAVTLANKALAIEPTTPEDYALQYFIKGGRVLRGSIKQGTNKGALVSLFTKSRQGGDTEIVSEMRSRGRLTKKAPVGLSLDAIAEKLFGEYQSNISGGDFGSNISSAYDYMDFRGAVESVLIDNKNVGDMAESIIKSKGKFTQADSLALSENEEYEKLRIKAEADAMGMTEQELLDKIADLENAPEIEAVDEAYSQALDMIDDEEFAKLYELNDEDVAKIDELMADLDSTDGALDDKLAEQKKAVRDLEAERKKVVAAMDKASKESQLDITGKAPIQEQLFGADTKSLTDRLQSIDVQLATAKADVAATQSAIDFQERGTVDMFEGKTETAPKKSSVQPLSEKSIDVLKTSRFGGNEQLEAWTEELELLDEKISKLEKAGKGRGFQSLDWFKEQAESYRGRIKRKKIELAEIEAELAAREVKPAEEAVPSNVLKDENGKPLVMYVGKKTSIGDGSTSIELSTLEPTKESAFANSIGFNTATVSLESFKRLNYSDILFGSISDSKLNELLKEAKKSGADGVIAIDGKGNIKSAYVFNEANIKEAKVAEKPQVKEKVAAITSEPIAQLEQKLYDAETALRTATTGRAKVTAENNVNYLKKAIEDKKAASLIEVNGGRYNNAQIRLAEGKKTTPELQARLDEVKKELLDTNDKIEEIEAITDAVGRGANTKPDERLNKLVNSRIELKAEEENITKALELRKARETKAPVESKAAQEMKSIQAEIEQYEREIEDALEEIENTKYNYNETVKEIALEKINVKATKLSRDEKADKLEELKAQVEDAADERDDYIEQYKEQIADAKAEIKKLNKRLAKLQEANPNVKFQKQGISVAPKSVGAIYNKYPNVVLDVFVSDSKKEISLDRIIVPKEDRNKGIGTDIVNDLTRYADANGYRINLTPSGDFGGSKDRLTKFYKGFGFVENKGKNKDFSTKELMYRLPLEKPNEEEINAEFSSTRDNTPIGFNYDTDLVARERFNIPALKRIGEGSDRVVFDLGDGNVLKVAKTARGLAQNIYEGSYDLVEEGILPEVLETGLNYIVAEKVEPAKGNKAVNALMRELKKFYQTDFNRRNPELQDVLEANDLGYVMNYDILYGDFSSARNWGVKNGKPIHLDGGTFGGIQMLQQYRDVKNLNDNDFREVYYKSRQAKAEFGDTDKFTKFQKQGISVAPEYKYQMNEMFKDPQRLTKDIEAKYDIRSTLNERGKIEGALIEVERKLTDQIVTNALSKVGVAAFKTIGAIENAPLFKAGTGKTVKLKEALTGWSGYTANKLRNATLKAIQGNNKYAASAGRVAASLIGNLAKSDVLQQQRALRSGSQLDANNSIAMLSKSLNGMIGFDDRALMRVHSLLDPEAFAILGGEDVVTSPSELSLQELRLYNTLRDMNDFIHEWHFQNEFIDQATYEKHKGKYFARMYEEIEKKEFADLQEAIDKMPGGADFRMFKERKDFSEIELTLMNDPIYITSRRLATMLHNKATLEFCNAMAADPAYTIYKNAADIPENNVSGFKLLDSRGGGKRYGDLTNKYVPLALYEELRGTAFANKFVSASYDALRMYDGLAVRQFFKKTKTLYNPTTRLGNITTNFAFAWLAGVDPFTMIKNRVKAKDSLDNYDSYAKELAIAGVLGTDVIAADLSQKKDAAGIVGFLEKVGLKKELANKARAVDKYMIESYGRTDDVAKISLYRSLVDDYGKSKEEAIRIVGESMQNYATVGKAYQYFSKMPLIGNPFVKFSSDMARIVANGFANRPLYMASFLGMMYGTARLLSGLSGEPEDEREARESRAFIPKIPLGFTDIPLTWKVGKYEVNAARFISPYYVYDAGYRSNTIAELTKFAPIQLSYSNKVGFASDYMPVMSDPFIAPLAQVAFDKDFRGLPIADPNGSKYTRQTVTEGEAIWNRFNYLGHSYGSPAWGYVANLYSAAKGEGDLYGRRRDIPSAILNSVIKVQEMESKDVQKAVINQVKYIDSEYKQIKTDITSRRNDDIDKIRDIIGSDATESQKEEQIMNVKANYSNYVEEMVGKMQELKLDREVPMNRLYKLQHPKKND